MMSAINDLFLAQLPPSPIHDDAVQTARSTDNGNGTFTYTPSHDFVGTDSFTYTATDVNGAIGNGHGRRDRHARR